MTRKSVPVIAIVLLLALAAGGAVLFMRRAAVSLTVEEKLRKAPLRQIGPKITTFSAAAKDFYGDSRYWLALCRANPGTSSLAGGQAMRVPAKNLADAYLQQIAEIKRTINASVEQMAVYHGFPERPFEYTPANPSDEAWLAAADSWQSPDGRFTLYEERRLKTPGRRWALYLVMKDPQGKRRGAPLVGVSSGSVGNAEAFWLHDSSKAVVKVRTGYDQFAGLGPETPFAYFLVDTSKAPEAIAVMGAHTKFNVGSLNLKDLTHFDEARLEKALAATLIDTKMVELPDQTRNQR